MKESSTHISEFVPSPGQPFVVQKIAVVVAGRSSGDQQRAHTDQHKHLHRDRERNQHPDKHKRHEMPNNQ